MATSKPEVIEAEATPIDRDVAVLTEAGKFLAEASAKSEKLAKEYQPREIASEDDFRQSRKERAAVRKDAEAIETEGRALIRGMEAFVADFKDGLKKAVTPLRDIDKAYKARNDEWDAGWVSRRRAELAEAYEDFAPDLVPLVPFERLLAAYGEQKGEKWLARGTLVAKAMESMYAAVEGIGRAEKAIDAFAESPEEATSIKAEYFQTLDLQGAQDNALRLREERARVAELEAERAERERMSQAAQAAAEHKEMVAEAIWEADPEASGVNAGGAVLVTDFPEPAPRTTEPETAPVSPVSVPVAPAPMAPAPMAPAPMAPTPVAPAPAAPAQEAPQPGAAHPWTVVIPSATRAQMEQLASALRAAGITGKIMAGSVAEVFPRLYFTAPGEGQEA